MSLQLLKVLFLIPDLAAKKSFFKLFLYLKLFFVVLSFSHYFRWIAILASKYTTKKEDFSNKTVIKLITNKENLCESDYD